jgi:glycosyltransferase involved in cell wall biosynthesis
LKVALIIGPCEPGKCGVGDYTIRLRDALSSFAGVDADILNTADWSINGAIKNSRSLRDYDLLHIQYPTAGFGHRLGPQAFSLLNPCVTTIHEASQRRLPRKLSLIPFVLRSRHLIFTSNYERRFVAGWAPWIAGHSSVIPVGTNIDVVPISDPTLSTAILYFGLIMPNKGLEQVLELAELMKKAQQPFTINIVGQVPNGHEVYFDHLRSKALNLPIEWHLGESDEQVARRLNQSSVAYLPYPDGASDRRTTLKSAISAGLAVITNQGLHTNSALANSVLLTRNPQEALVAIQHLFTDQDAREDLSQRAVKYSRRYSWARIARLHLKVYRSVSACVNDSL